MVARAWELSGSFGLENLKLTSRAPRALAAGEVRLRMLASALNYRDVLMIAGIYNPRLALPLIPLSDGVGEVVEVGSEVDDFSVGDRVLPLFTQRWFSGDPTREDIARQTLGGPLDGTLTQEFVVSAESVVRAPGRLEPPAAATLPCAGLTAWSALVEHGEITDDSKVLIEGTGGVALFALQIAKGLGAEVFAITSSDEKRELLQTLGADATHNYRNDPAWGKAARAWSDGKGVDVVVDVGGAQTIPEALASVRPGGRIALIGNLSGSKNKFDLIPILMNQIRVQGVFVGHKKGLQAFCRFVERSTLEPVIDRTFTFDEAPTAFAHLEAAQHIGKLVIDHR